MPIDRILLFIFGIFGFILFLLSAVVFNDITVHCVNSRIKNMWITLLVLGLCLSTVSSSYGVCAASKNCAIEPKLKDDITGLHYVLFVIFFILLLSISAVIIDETNKLSQDEKDKCDSKNKSKNAAIFILVVSIIGLLVCAVGLYKNFIQ